jgi:hypothetical protein
MLKDRLMPLSGIVFVALILSAVLLAITPESSASAGTVLAYYQAHQGAVFARAVLTGFGVILGLLFFGYLYDYLRRDAATRWLASTAFGGLLVFAAGGAVAAGSFAALSDKPQTLTAATAQALNLIQLDVANGLIRVGLTVFYLAIAAAILRGKLLPAWLGWLSVILGLTAASVVGTLYAFMATGVWAAAVAIVMWGKAAPERTSQEGAPRTQEAAGRP